MTNNLCFNKNTSSGCHLLDKPKNHNKRWTKEEEKRLILNYSRGSSPEYIAIELQRTTISILSRLADFDIIEYNKDEEAYFTIPTKIYQF